MHNHSLIHNVIIFPFNSNKSRSGKIKHDTNAATKVFIEIDTVSDKIISFIQAPTKGYEIEFPIAPCLY